MEKVSSISNAVSLIRVKYATSFGNPEQWPQRERSRPKSWLFSNKNPYFWAIWRDLEKFGFWFGLNVSAYNPCYDWLSYLTQLFKKKSKKNFLMWSEKIFLWSRCFDVQIIQNRFIPVLLPLSKNPNFNPKSSNSQTLTLFGFGQCSDIANKKNPKRGSH